MTPMKWAMLVALLAGLSGYEAMTIWTPASGDTLSEIIWRAAADWPVVPFLAGFLAGHLFWPTRTGGKD